MMLWAKLKAQLKGMSIFIKASHRLNITNKAKQFKGKRKEQNANSRTLITCVHLGLLPRYRFKNELLV